MHWFRLRIRKFPWAQTGVALGENMTGPKEPLSVTLNLLILQIWEESKVGDHVKMPQTPTVFPETSLSQIGMMYISRSSKNCNREAVGEVSIWLLALSGTIKEQTSKASSKSLHSSGSTDKIPAQPLTSQHRPGSRLQRGQEIVLIPF